jgi:hypothetical protein
MKGLRELAKEALLDGAGLSHAFSVTMLTPSVAPFPYRPFAFLLRPLNDPIIVCDSH